MRRPIGLSALVCFLVACDGQKDADPDSAAPDSDADTDSDSDSDADSDADTDTDTDTVTECGTTLTEPPAGSTCSVVSPGTSGLLLRGDVLAPDGALRGGSVLIEGDGTIGCAGCDCSGEAAFATATVVDCPDGAISPGLVNAHDHITYANGTPFSYGDVRFDHRHEWRETLSVSGTTDSANTVRWGEIRMLASGVTATLGSGSQAGLVRNLDSSSYSGLDVGPARLDTFPLGDSDGDFQPDCAWDYDGTEAQAAGYDAYVPHVAEGIDAYAAEEFRCLSDGFTGEDVTETNAAHIHAIGLTTLDYAAMAHDGATLIWSPRSDVSLYGETARVTTFARLGGTIALGTNWVYSGSMNMGRELACAAYLDDTRYDDTFTEADLWRMATEGGAHAAGARDRIGRLAEGLRGDVAVFAEDHADLWSAVVQSGQDDVVLVLRDGIALYGEADVTLALNPACDAVELCDSPRALCATAETGSSYETIAAAVPEAYPAISCDPVPLGEPTCEPSRPGEYDGITDGDRDGDGLADALDLCPDVFAPIRPMDAGEQSDLDADGVGDACDPTPLPPDVDGDGVTNDLDVCPWAADDQADDDADGKGNACDPCPDTANPDRGCP